MLGLPRAIAKRRTDGEEEEGQEGQVASEDKSAQLSDEEQAAQAEATRLAAQKADAEAAAAAAAAAQKALDALPKGVLATALADGRVHKIVRGHALRAHEQHASLEKEEKEERRLI